MAPLSISSLVSFFSDELKSLTRGENHYKCNDIESFTYSDGIIRGEVHASMKKKVYKVTVSLRSTPAPKLSRRRLWGEFVWGGGGKYQVIWWWSKICVETAINRRNIVFTSQVS